MPLRWGRLCRLGILTHARQLVGNRGARQAVPALKLCAATLAHVRKKFAASLGAAMPPRKTRSRSTFFLVTARRGRLVPALPLCAATLAHVRKKFAASLGGGCAARAKKRTGSYLRTPLKMGFRRLFASGQSPTGYFFGGYLPAATLESSCIGPFGPYAENPSDRIIRDTPQTRTNSPVMLPGRLKNHIKKANYGGKKTREIFKGSLPFPVRNVY